jgi:hypothetical protein
MPVLSIEQWNFSMGPKYLVLRVRITKRLVELEINLEQALILIVVAKYFGVG